MKSITVVCMVLGLMFTSAAHSQIRSQATQNGATLIGGTLSFASQGGDLYEGFDDDRLTTIMLSPTLFYFVAPGFALGANLAFTRLAQGDASFTTLGIGPTAGVFFDSGSKAIPFFAGGVNYISLGSDGEDESGLGANFGGGVLIRQDHLAFSIEVTYVYERFKPEGFDESITGNTIFVGIGLAGFLY